MKGRWAITSGVCGPTDRSSAFPSHQLRSSRDCVLHCTCARFCIHGLGTVLPQPLPYLAPCLSRFGQLQQHINSSVDQVQIAA